MADFFKKCIPKKDRPAFLFLAITGTFSHFLYEWTKNALIAFFCPVNESVWEHQKLLFFPFLLWSLWDCARRRQAFRVYFFCRFLGVVCGMLSVIVLFYTYTGITGTDFFVADILIFLIGILATLHMTRWFSQCVSEIPAAGTIYLAWLALALCFMAFTCFPPDLPLFYAL